MSIRVTECLQRLKINFKFQEFIAGRFIDFTIEDNILLEVDGVFHY
jgi:very-short-patch-repair endonuclease